MIRRVRYLTPAVLELERAFDRYVDRSAQVAAAFLDEVERAVEQLREFPESAPELVAPVRRKVLLKYPFSVLYHLKNEREGRGSSDGLSPSTLNTYFAAMNSFYKFLRYDGQVEENLIPEFRDRYLDIDDGG